MTPPMMTLGINTCFAVKRWARPEQWARILRNELGLSDIQFSIDLLPQSFGPNAALEHAAEVREVARSAGVCVNSVFTGLGAYGSNLLLSDSLTERDAAEVWYEHIIALTSAIGAKGAGGHLGAFSVPSANDERARQSLWKELVQRLHRLAAGAEAAGLDYLLFENLAVDREPGYSIEEAHQLEDDLLASSVPWRLCLDLGHPAALRTGPPSDMPSAWVSEEWKNTPVVQLQQSPRGSDHHGAFTAANNRNGLVQRDEILTAISTWNVPVVELYLEIIPAHEADDNLIIRDLVESVDYWRTGIQQVNS